MITTRLLRLVLCLSLMLAASASAADAPDAGVTATNLLQNESFWPYHVALTQPFGALKGGTVGVLVRLESATKARIDFGREGLHEVPVESTNIVERAKGVQLGTVYKGAPNLVQAIGPRLVDTKADPPAPVPFEAVRRKESFLAVFADPAGKGFAELAKELAPLVERKALLVILFPQGKHEDSELYEKLRAMGWKAPYVSMIMAASYTRSLLPEGATLPFLQLQTPEGRVLFQRAWSKGELAQLTAAIDSALGNTDHAAAEPPAS